jgi:hypothetical protein
VRRLGHPASLCALLLALTPAGALAERHHHLRSSTPIAQTAKLPPAVSQVLKDCNNHNRLQHHYALAVLQQALRDMPTDTREYTICSTEIENAISAELGVSRPAPKASAATRLKVAQGAPTELQQAQSSGGQPVSLGGARITAGAVQVNGGSLLGGLPTPILIVLIVLIALGAVPVGIRLRSIVRARRTP